MGGVVHRGHSWSLATKDMAFSLYFAMLGLKLMSNENRDILRNKP